MNRPGGIEGLDPGERAELAARCAADPSAAVELARRLAFEELISQATDPARGDFAGRLQRRMAGRRRGNLRLLGAALAVAAAVAVAWILLLPGGGTPTIRVARGAAVAGGPALAAGQRMPQGVEVAVDPQGGFEFAVHGTVVRVAGGAVVEVGSRDDGFPLRLVRGSIQAAVAAPYRIDTAWASASASSASFTVAVGPASTLVQVETGTVRCRGREATDAEVALGPGGSFTAGPAAVPGPAADARPGPSSWRLEPWGGAAELRVQADEGGAPLLHVSLPGPLPARPWTYLAHPLRIGPDDRFVRFRVRVLASAPGSRLGVQLHMRDGPTVLMRDIPLPPAGSGWVEVSTGLAWRPLKVVTGPAVAFDPAAVDGLVAVPYGGVRELEIADPRMTP